MAVEISNVEPSIHPRIPERVSVAVLGLRGGKGERATNCVHGSTQAHEGMWSARAQRGRNQSISA